MKSSTLHDQLQSQLSAPAKGRTSRILVSDNALKSMAEEARWPAGSDLLIVCDAHTRAAAGDQLVDALTAAGRTAELCVLEPGGGDDHLVCDVAAIAELRRLLSLRGQTHPVAVGAGTVNDIVKKASAELERDYTCVPTAASMNGYTSSIAAILADGVKRTVPAHQPCAIYVPLQVVSSAPAYLNRAGFGDLLSKPLSNADWLLSHFVRGVSYDPAPAALLDEAYNALIDHAEDVSSGAETGVRILTETLLLSGFSMALAGTSAPASGGEHLVSHYWDMEQHCHGRPLQALHGTQVGVATRLSAMLFERLVATDISAIGADGLDDLVARRADDTWLSPAPFEAVHPTLTAAVRAEVRAQIAAKQRHGLEFRAELEQVIAAWPSIRAAIEATLLSSHKITRALERAGCVTKASEIGVETERLVHTLRVCRQMRSRYVALDLMDDFGLLDGWAAEVAAQSEAT